MASLLYETLLLIAALFLATALLLAALHAVDPALKRPLIQFGLLAVTGGYFVYCWAHGGQTLPMKTWHIRLTAADGGPVSPRQALARYLFALIGLLAGGAGFAWALVDTERQFLHDRLAGTRLVNDQGRTVRAES